MGAGRARVRAGGGVGAGRAAPVALGPRGRLYKPAGEAAPAALCSRHSAPSVPATDPTSLVPEQTFIHEICAGKDSTLSPAPPDLRERG